MPNFNGMGPNGQGAMTGRGQGACARRNAGGGFFSRGMGRYFNGFFRGGTNAGTYSIENEEKDLKARLAEIEAEKKNN